MVSKKEIIENLSNTYCRLKPSKCHGVGVYAIKDIPKGINPFKREKPQSWIKINIKEIGITNKEIIKMIDAFYVIKKNGDFWVNSGGLVSMGMSFYLNTSKKPNIRTTDDGEHFKTIKKIKKGEELLTDYADYDWKYK
ncbi:MAG: SET domain-containing protein-lysine N-methyltransferase [archaeon]